MRTLKLSLAAVAAALAFNANAAPFDTGPSGMNGKYQGALINSTDLGAAQDIGMPDGIAFHAGGVAACDGCHVMHNAAPGPGAKSTTGLRQSVTAWTNVTNMYLLQGSDQSSTCLICHQGTNGPTTGLFQIADLTTGVSNSVAPTNYTPGGDFGWLKADFTNSPGQRHGHNVAAGDWDLNIDPDLHVAPGGSWASGAGRQQFACSSCHDPHGRYRMQANAGMPYGVEFKGPSSPGTAVLPIAASGSYGKEPTETYAVGAYRLLAGQGYAPASNPAYPFPNNPPIAVAPTNYNRTEGATETRVAYGTGMSEWCQNCHTAIHMDGYTSGVAGLSHPAGSDAYLHAQQVGIYNSYVSSGKLDANTNVYTSLVPFELGSAKASLSQLQAAGAANNIVASGTSTVMCLSCHRAHASAFNSMVRWDQDATFLTGAVGANGADGFTQGLTNRTSVVTQAGYYGRTVGTANGTTTLGAYQRSLCNKCHGKD